MWRFTGSLAFVLLFVLTAPAATPKSVLILYEGSRLMPYQSMMSGALQKDFANSKFDIQIFEEYLERWRLHQDLARRSDALEAKFAGRKFDVVVADGAQTLELLVNEPPEFLRGTPVVFVDVADSELPSYIPPNITGVATHIDFAPSIRLAMKLQPGLQHVYYIESDPGSDASMSTVLDPEFAPFRDQLDIVAWRDLALDDLLKRVESLPPHSAVLFNNYYRGPSGRAYVPFDISTLIATHANAPVYTLYQTMVGNGPVGGVVVNFETIGSMGARIVLALLGGEPVSKYPVERSTKNVILDWRQIQKFGFSQSRIPPSATILFRPPSLWTKYHWYIIAAAFVIFLQTALIIELAFAGKRWKKSERSARDLARRVINAQEDERRRLAGELHDDVSQRLALIAIHLRTLCASPLGAREDLLRELKVLVDETELISSDIHQFSHELHPAILERLGLASALRRYCAEFAAHRKISVDMSKTGEEPPINLDTALAFFRIGQECLTNAAKHSGTATCKVSLDYTPHRITLTVEDKGRGFDQSGAQEHTGLGLQSMRERLRSIDGTLRIQSSPLFGTTIIAEAWLTPALLSHEIKRQKVPGAQPRASNVETGIEHLRDVSASRAFDSTLKN